MKYFFKTVFCQEGDENLKTKISLNFKFGVVVIMQFFTQLPERYLKALFTHMR